MFAVESILKWLLISNITSSVLIVIILLAKFVFKFKVSASWHYCIWFLLVIRLVVPVFHESSVSIFNILTINANKLPVVKQLPIDLVQNTSEKTASKTSELTPIDSSTTVETTSSGMKTNVKTSSNTKYITIFIIWITGSLLLLVYTIYNNLKFNKKISGYIKCNDKRIERLFEECKKKININSDIPILITEHSQTPALYGLFKPKILMAASFAKKFSDNELKYIFMHELSHFKRKDIFTYWIITILQIVHWFNPLIWYAFYKLRQDCEIACDASAMKYIDSDEYKDYGQLIIRCLRVFSKPSFVQGTLNIAKNKSSIKRRIIMISKFKSSKSKFIPIVAALIAIGIAITCLTSNKSINKTLLVAAKQTNNKPSCEKEIKSPILSPKPSESTSSKSTSSKSTSSLKVSPSAKNSSIIKTDGVNLLKNSSFENVDSNWRILDPGFAVFSKEFSHSGRYSMKMDFPTSIAKYLDISNFSKTSRYLLTGYIKAVGTSRGTYGDTGEYMNVNMYSGYGDSLYTVQKQAPVLAGTFDWKYQSILFSIPENTNAIEIIVGIDGKGTIYVDDMKLEKVID